MRRELVDVPGDISHAGGIAMTGTFDLLMYTYIVESGEGDIDLKESGGDG